MSDSLSLNPDKNNISWIAYYNISGFVNSDNYNPQNLNNPVYAKGLNIYDNGVSFTYSHPNVKRDFTVRAGNKEWITAHMNKKETYTQDSKTDISKFNSVNSYPELDYSDLKGDYDIMPWDVQDSGANDEKNINQNTLYSTIKDCLTQSPFWNSNDYNPEDLGLYNYKFGDAKVSIYSVENDRGSYQFQYTSKTTIKEAYVVSSLYGDTSLQGYDLAYLDFQGKRITGQGGGSDHVALDVTETLRDEEKIDFSVGLDGNFSAYFIIIWK